MKISLEEILGRIERGEDIAHINRSLIVAPERELLKRCAAVRNFDQPLVDEYFRPGVPGGDEAAFSFEQLTSHDFVEPVPRAEGVYRLHSLARQEYFEAWWLDENLRPNAPGEVPAALREFSRALRAYYESLKKDGELDLLAQQAAVDSAQARALFDRLYGAADAAFDLARCRDIIGALRGREQMLGHEFAAYLREKDRYLQSRSLWAVEYYQTERYLERESVLGAAEAFLGASGSPRAGGEWILNVHAPGGRGKTMFLLWLISRRCVANRILCAKIDFDLVEDRERTVEHPWLLVLDIARQLEAQTPGGLFHHIIKKLSEDKAILDNASPESRGTQPAAPDPSEPSARLDPEIADRFAKAIAVASGGRPVVLILDTLEEVMLYYRERIKGMVEQMQTLHNVSPNILLILSGRYDLTDERQGFKEFIERYGDQTRSLEIQPFTEAESLSFLTKKMRLTEDRPLRAVAARSEGNPFKLALFANLLRDDASITEETVWSYPSVDLLYLIKRVLIRLRNKQLHWLLRYGAVPRKLNVSFLKEVMKNYLLRAMSGDTSQDDPRHYEGLPDEARREKILPTDLIEEPSEGAVDLDALWKELRNYASTNAWVLPAAPADTEAVVFHSDVVNPMRRWLRGEPVYKSLHTDAVRYYEEKARADASNWAKWMLEAVYHKFQLEGEGAYTYWRRLLDGEEAADNPSWRRELAREVIRSEYVDENLEPRPHTDSDFIVSKRTLVEALYESARAALHMARESDADAVQAQLSEAEVDILKCEQVQKTLPEPAISPARLTAMLARIRAARGRDAAAVEMMAQALAAELPDDERLELLLAYSNALAREGDYAGAVKVSQSALMLAERLEHPNTRLLFSLHISRANFYQATEDWNTALTELRHAQSFVKPGDRKTRSETLMQSAEIYVEAGHYARAAEEANQVVADNAGPEMIDLWYNTFMGRLRLGVLDPVGAVMFCDRALAGGRQSLYAGGAEERHVLELIALAGEIRGAALGELMEYDDARSSLERARADYQKIGDRAKANRCLLRTVELVLTCVGDVGQADALLGEADRLSLQTNPDEWVYQRLLKARILHLSGESAERQKVFELLMSQASSEHWPARLSAMLLLERARYEPPEAGAPVDNLLSSVTEMLERVEPVSARLFLLDTLREYPTNLKASPPVAFKLAGLLRDVPADEHLQFLSQLKLADLYRVAGGLEESRIWLRNLTEHLLSGEKLFPMRDVLNTWGRMGWRKEDEQAVRRCVEMFREEFATYPALCRAFMVEMAKLAAESKLYPLAVEQLERAEAIEVKSDGSQWEAQIYEVRGKLATEYLLSSVGKAVGAIMLGVDIYKRLNNSLAADVLRAEIARRKGSPTTDEQPELLKGAEDESTNPPPDADAVPVVTARLAAGSPEGITFEVDIPGAPATEKTARTKDAATDGLVKSLLNFSSVQSYSYEFLQKLEANWAETGERLGELVLGEAQSRVLYKIFGKPGNRFFRKRGRNGFDFCLKVDGLQLSSVPWELMRLPTDPEGPASISPAVRYFYRLAAHPSKPSRPETAWLQKALSSLMNRNIIADGIIGPQTVQQLRQFQLSNGLGVTGVFDAPTRRRLKSEFQGSGGEARRRVLMMQPSAAYGSDIYADAGGNLPPFYRETEFEEMQLVEPPTVEQLQNIFEKFTPDVVHVCAAVHESPSIGIYLDFNTPEVFGASGSGGSYGAGAEGIPVTTLDRLLKRIQDKAGTRPHFILDVLPPRGLTELLSQLLLRNALASQIFSMGNCASVIATGLSPAGLELRYDTLHALLSALGRDEGCGKAVYAARSAAVKDQKAKGWKRFDMPPDRLLETLIATAGTVLFTDEPRA